VKHRDLPASKWGGIAFVGGTNMLVGKAADPTASTEETKTGMLLARLEGTWHHFLSINLRPCMLAIYPLNFFCRWSTVRLEIQAPQPCPLIRHVLQTPTYTPSTSLIFPGAPSRQRCSEKGGSIELQFKSDLHRTFVGPGA